ncbi:MAG: guanosine monophosphate reductase [Pelagibacteraceae bacterium TMED216]|nr:MAG: guanosine monophosphate reductase [Pelagibacteraceae bacterium TMED216]|tara:strand:- start:5267 stop:6346 length:1080 start_codon:yes stop_codon:yes gene_type:complete
MELIKEALTFDDVLLLPKHSKVLPNETDISLNLSKNLKLKFPFLSAAMDTVTEYEMALEMAKQGGLGIIHRNLSVKEQGLQVKKIKKKNFKVGAAVGTTSDDIYRAKFLSDNDVDIIIVDTAHGDSKKVFQTVYNIKKINKKNIICAGNIATGEAAKSLYNVGADIVKVGIGPGSICTTRMIAGIGVPQITAISNVKDKLKKKNIKIISDGGIKFSGDIIKALAAGADAIMMGSIFAGTKESPGKKFKIKNKYYKNYRGMGSIGAMSAGSSNRYFQKNYKDKSKFIAEGVEGRVEYKGPLSKIIYQLQGGLRSSMGYIGAKNLKEIKKNAKFIKITKAGFYESMVHSVDANESSLNFKL